MTAVAGPAGPAGSTRSGLLGGVGDSLARPDGRQKVTGEFAYSSDLWLDSMLWGATLRSPHPRARLTGLDITRALALPGVTAVLTHDDVPGSKTYGLEHKDQPVLAGGQVRYQGEPVALVAACRAARCAGSARSRPVSPTRRRWTSSPPPCAQIRWSSGSRTRCGRGR